ncbi:hypothetical protein [Microbacterium sp. TPD7012]|uniref:hypothetical protein n=1 Tax=Microbacterium sp. TPD7012 TaxID=2171975 RepID=UPI000D51D924|nr:hypothetical protein [Microbacterium sp. TPD7012]PVE94986.1 hypothetical protein DC434_13760 [Microbacterium sp. TPD7012]
MQNTSISRANFTVRDGGHIIIENGGLDVTGSANITGALNGSGTIDWTGPSIFRGTLNVTGNSAFSGTMYIGGVTTLATTLNVLGGLIQAGAVTITPTGGGMIQLGSLQIDGDLGGTIRSSGTVYLTGAASTSVRVTGLLAASDALVLGKITAGELDVVGPKSFRMVHPSKPETHWLRHGSTESPVSGIEYWGNEVLGADGKFVVELADYFEDLAKPENRSVLVTGRGFNADWTDIEDGKFTVTGTPGGRFSWLVKAERFGGDFLLEEEKPTEEPEEWSDDNG